jgi:hypothetical protein
VFQDHAHLPPSRIQKTPSQGFWLSEVMFYVYDFDLSDRIWLVDFGSYLVFFFNDSRRSSLHTFLFVLFV